MPLKKIPSNVPAPPIEAVEIPKFLILDKLAKSAPIRVPILPNI
jgi:hypothetical protein